MIKLLFKVLLVLAALFIAFPAHANTTATASVPIDTVSIPVVQPISVDTKVPGHWLDGRASLVGGLITTSKQQFNYAEARGLRVANSSNFAELVGSGYLQRLEGPNLRMKTDEVVPYVLPHVKNFVLSLAFDYGQADCGILTVTNALRLGDGKMPRAASVFSVHPRGMAVDVRVTNIGERCETWLNDYLTARENRMTVDATREHWIIVRGRKMANPHFHLVVPLPERITPVSITETELDQSN